MNVTQFLEELRDILMDPSATDWTDKELVRTGSRMQRKMIRKQVQVNEGYHNYEHTVLGTAAIKVFTDTYDYPLPDWAISVSEVRQMQVAGESRGPIIQHIKSADKERGWFWHGMKTIRIQGFASATDVIFDVAKLPASPTRGTVKVVSATNKELYLENDGSSTLEFPNETFDGFYVNTRVQMTGVDSVSHAISGSVARCSADTHLVDVAGTLYTKLTLETALRAVPAVNDTYETIFEISDEHTRLIVLLTARSACIKKGNQDIVALIDGELREEMQAYVAHIQPRQFQGPSFYRTHTQRHGRRQYDLDQILEEFA